MEKGLNPIIQYQFSVCPLVNFLTFEIMKNFWKGGITVYMDHTRYRHDVSYIVLPRNQVIVNSLATPLREFPLALQPRHNQIYSDWGARKLWSLIVQIRSDILIWSLRVSGNFPLWGGGVPAPSSNLYTIIL